MFYKFELNSKLVLNFLKAAVSVAVLASTMGFSGCFNFVTAAASRSNVLAAKDSPLVIMISIDGFRYDYMDLYKPANLMKIAAAGVRAKGLVASFPTLTFPNHITLVTGLYPGHHGIVSNRFYDEASAKTYDMLDGNSVNDASFYRGEPIWTVAEKSGMLSATYFWVGSEAKIGGVDPTYMVHYDGTVPNAARGQQVIDWLKMPSEKRPHFISLYFSDVDTAGHKFGSKSPEVAAAVADIDGVIGNIWKEAKNSGLPVQFVIVSDHGMEEVLPKQVINLAQFTDLKLVKAVERGAISHFYSDDKAAIDKVYADLEKNQNHFKVYLANQIPKQWSYDDLDRVGDILVVAEPGFYLTLGEGLNGVPERVSVATHGWDPSYQKMQGLFIASGSLIKSGMTIEPFENIHVYPFVLKMLGLHANQKVDGDEKVLATILKR